MLNLASLDSINHERKKRKNEEVYTVSASIGSVGYTRISNAWMEPSQITTMQTINRISSYLEQPDRFRDLQQTLRDRWQTVELFDSSDADILIVPSISIDQRELRKIDGCEHYEERLLFSLIRLRNPRTRLIYVTSLPLHPSVIDYYLQLLPGIPFSHARNRLLLLSTYDASVKPLTQKILDRPRLIERIRQALRHDKAFMVCYNATEIEADLSLKLGVPLYASCTGFTNLGNKKW